MTITSPQAINKIQRLVHFVSPLFAHFLSSLICNVNINHTLSLIIFQLTLMIISLEWLNQTPRNGSIKLIALPILAIVEVKHPIYYKISLIFFFKIPSFNNSFLFCQYPYSTFLFQINFIDVDPDPNISTFRPLDQMVVKSALKSACQI